jgi:hypothetical protein
VERHRRAVEREQAAALKDAIQEGLSQVVVVQHVAPDLRRGHRPPHAQPRPQGCGRDFPQRQAALTSTFAVYEDARVRLERHVAALQAHEL